MEGSFVPRFTARLGGKKVLVDHSLIVRDERGRERVATMGAKGRVRFTLPKQLTQQKMIEA